MAAHHQTLRDRQVGELLGLNLRWWLTADCDLASIERVLNLNRDPGSASDEHHDQNANGLLPQSTPILNSDGAPIWKVLVFDNLGRDVISSVLRVNDLRGWGITIHLYIHLRSTIQFAPLLTFCR